MKYDVAVIGAGIGGIATSILLARKGYNVSVFEKNSYPGGRCGSITKERHRFDTGATMIMMPGIYEKFYNSIGRTFKDEFELFQMDPTYKIKFHNGKEFLFSPDLHEMRKQLESFEQGSYGKFLKYMSKTSNAFSLSMKYFINRNFNNMFNMINVRNMFLLFRLKAYRNQYSYIGGFFKHDALRYIFTLQNLYIGQNPLTASAVFAGLPYMELSEGVWFPRGGMSEVAKNLFKIAKENKVEFYLNSPVKEIKIRNKCAEGITLNDQSFHKADIVVSNADLPYIHNHLLPKGIWTRRINLLNYTCSAIVFHWGLDIVYPQLKQHNLFVSSSYKKDIRRVFKEKSLPDEQTFYLHSPVRSDQTAAPSGQDSITAVVQVGHLASNLEQNWSLLKKKARKGIIQRLEKEGMKNFEKHIKFEICYLPKTWQTLFNLTKGAAFGSVSHNLSQMGYFRPHNKHFRYKNLFFVGSSTQPGSGVPLVLLSAMLTSERIIHKFK